MFIYIKRGWEKIKECIYQSYLRGPFIILILIMNILFGAISQVYEVDQVLSNIIPCFYYFGYGFRAAGSLCQKINKQFGNNMWKCLEKIAMILRFFEKLHVEIGYIFIALSHYEKVQVVKVSMVLAIANSIIILFDFFCQHGNNEQQIQQRNQNSVEPEQQAQSTSQMQAQHDQEIQNDRPMEIEIEAIELDQILRNEKFKQENSKQLQHSPKIFEEPFHHV